jgi:hypothetical protein
MRILRGCRWIVVMLCGMYEHEGIWISLTSWFRSLFEYLHSLEILDTPYTLYQYSLPPIQPLLPICNIPSPAS